MTKKVLKNLEDVLRLEVANYNDKLADCEAFSYSREQLAVIRGTLDGVKITTGVRGELIWGDNDTIIGVKLYDGDSVTEFNFKG